MKKLEGIKTERGAEILLILVLVARSTSFVMSKVTMNAMNPFNLLGVRFLLAFLLLCIPFGKRLVKIKKQTLLKGLLVGLAFFCVMTAELFYAPADSLIYIIFFGKYGDRICTDL